MDTEKKHFDPNGPGEKGKIFGLPYELEAAAVVILPVPWEVTVSYASGTADGPEAIRTASAQVDLYQDDIPNAHEVPIYMLPEDTALKSKSDQFRALVAPYLEWLEAGAPEEEALRFANVTSLIDTACEDMIAQVKRQATELLDQGKAIGLLGGDHSTPLGLLQALAERHDAFGVLQIDAHADLREAYEGFKYSHASISYNFLKLPQISRCTQVGIRDYCEEEARYMQRHADRVKVYTDKALKKAGFGGTSWQEQCAEIIATLPQKVYVSFDIDGLDPKLCPNTGTPVPGGLEFDQVMHLFDVLVASGRQIIGFDLNEVAPAADHDWNENVGARVLYRMALLLAVSTGAAGLQK
jgi:agmatinase